MQGASRKALSEMEPSAFDSLTKVLATSTSRRQALKTLAAMALGGVLGLGGIGNTFARPCKPNGIGCNIGSQCCSGGCCHGTCTDLGTTSNCGACGHSCASGQGCCGGTCTDLNTNSNCGSCGHACGTNQICCNGTCSTPCNGICCNGTCLTNNNGETCVTNCTTDTDCSSGCHCYPDTSGAMYCSNGTDIHNSPCLHDDHCPTGSFCSTHPVEKSSPSKGHCFEVC